MVLQVDYCMGGNLYNVPLPRYHDHFDRDNTHSILQYYNFDKNIYSDQTLFLFLGKEPVQNLLVKT